MTVCGPIVVTVMFVDTTVVGPCPLADAGEQVASAGKPLQVKLSAVVKLLDAMNPTVVVPDSPGLLSDTSVGPDRRAKPGWIVNVTGVELLLALKLESPG